MREQAARVSYRLIAPLICFLVIGFVGTKLLSSSHADNYVKVTSSTTTRGLSRDFLGYNGNNVAGNWTNPAFLSALKELQPEAMRGYPGGTSSDYFNWGTGQYYMTAAGQDYIQPGKPTPPSSLDVFTTAVKTAGASAVFDMNVMTYCPADNNDPQSTDQAGASCTEAQACGPLPATYTTACTNPDKTWGLPYEIRMLKTAQSQGVPIKYVELGNELYGGNDEYLYYFPSVQDYISKMNAWIPVIKQNFPGVKVAVVGYGSGSCQSIPNRRQIIADREDNWNTAIYNGIHGADAVTFHTYYSSNLPNNGSVRNGSDVATLLSSAAQKCTTSVNGLLAKVPSNLSVWVTEWNLNPDDTTLVQGSWADGLVQATYGLGLTRQGKIEIATSHDIVDSQVWGALFQQGSRYITGTGHSAIQVPTTPAPLATPFNKSAQGFTLSNLQRSLHGATSTTTLNFSSTPTIGTTGATGLLGQSFYVNGHTNLFFMNLTASAVNLDVCSLSGHYSGVQYASAPDNFVVANNSVPTTNLTVTNAVSLPAYSVTSLVGSSASTSNCATSSPGNSQSHPTTTTASTSPTSVATTSKSSTPTGASGEAKNARGSSSLTPRRVIAGSTISSRPSRAWLAIPFSVLIVSLAVIAYLLHWTRYAHLFLNRAVIVIRSRLRR